MRQCAFQRHIEAKKCDGNRAGQATKNNGSENAVIMCGECVRKVWLNFHKCRQVNGPSPTARQIPFRGNACESRRTVFTEALREKESPYPVLFSTLPPRVQNCYRPGAQSSHALMIRFARAPNEDRTAYNCWRNRCIGSELLAGWRSVRAGHPFRFRGNDAWIYGFTRRRNPFSFRSDSRVVWPA
jgi:hypothetical protein